MLFAKLHTPSGIISSSFSRIWLSCDFSTFWGLFISTFLVVLFSSCFSISTTFPFTILTFQLYFTIFHNVYHFSKGSILGIPYKFMYLDSQSTSVFVKLSFFSVNQMSCKSSFIVTFINVFLNWFCSFHKLGKFLLQFSHYSFITTFVIGFYFELFPS